MSPMSRVRVGGLLALATIALLLLYGFVIPGDGIQGLFENALLSLVTVVVGLVGVAMLAVGLIQILARRVKAAHDLT